MKTNKLNINIFILYFLSFSSAYSIEVPKLKNLLIYEEKSKIDSNIKKIDLIDKDKLIELKSLFDNNLIETDEYEALRKDLLKIL